MVGEKKVITAQEFHRLVLKEGQKDFSNHIIHGDINMGDFRTSYINLKDATLGDIWLNSSKIDSLDFGGATTGKIYLGDASGKIYFNGAITDKIYIESNTTCEIVAEPPMELQIYLRLAARLERNEGIPSGIVPEEIEKWLKETDKASKEWFQRLALWQFLYDIQIAQLANRKKPE